jgi:hypothetical protein
LLQHVIFITLCIKGKITHQREITHVKPTILEV